MGKRGKIDVQLTRCCDLIWWVSTVARESSPASSSRVSRQTRKRGCPMPRISDDDPDALSRREHATVAQRFNAGRRCRAGRVPKGRMKNGLLNRPLGTQRCPTAIPGLKRLVILGSSLRDEGAQIILAFRRGRRAINNARGLTPPLTNSFRG
jgi:hypothetical protein